MIRRCVIGPVLCVLLAACGCGPRGKAPASASAPPAKVAKIANEQELATVTLTPEAVKRLGLATAPVELRPVRRRRTLGGEVMFPPGQAIAVSAPLGGTLAAPEGGGVPAAGAHVSQGQAVFQLLPLLSPERAVLTPTERVTMAHTKANLATAQLEADKLVQSAKVQVHAAQIAYDRAKQLFEDKAGSRQGVDDADAQLRLANESLSAAKARKELLDKISLDSDAGQLTHRPIVSPVDGILVALAAAPGQAVVSGAPLFSVATHHRLWVRVPVYVAQWRDVAADEPARITEFGEPPTAPGFSAKPVAAPPTADPLAATVDLCYEVQYDEATAKPRAGPPLRPGHKVAVTLALKGEENRLVAPWSAVYIDIHGNTWLYEQTAPQTFVRRRVEVEYVSGRDVVLARGPKAGASVVTEGVAELVGTEFGFAK